MRFKKAVAAVACVAMVGTMFAGCGSSETSGSASSAASGTSSASSAASSSSAAASSSSAAAEGNWKVAMCMSHQTNDFQITITGAAVERGAELGIEVVIFDGNNDSATQLSQLEQCIAQGYDGIMFEPINVDAVTGVVQEASAAGIPVVNVVGAMTDWQNYVAGYSGGDNVTAGQLEMEKVVELIGGSGKIAILNGPMGSDPQIQRHEGYDLVLAENPDVEVVYEADCEWDTALAMSTVENWLSSGTELAAIVCQNDGMAVGAGKAVSDAGKTGIVVTGVDATSDGIEAIKNGTMTGTVSQDAAGQGSNAVDMMYTLLTGGTIEEPDMRTENIWLDASNVE